MHTKSNLIKPHKKLKGKEKSKDCLLSTLWIKQARTNFVEQTQEYKMNKISFIFITCTSFFG